MGIPPQVQDNGVLALEKALFGDRPTPTKDKPVEAAAALALAPGPTCGACRHWKQLETPTVGVVDLGKPKRGECRQGPPQTSVFVNQQGQVMGSVSQYPNLPTDFPACGQHEEKA